MTARLALTYDDYAALPDDGRRYELHEGELFVTPAPRPRHQLVVGNLYVILAEHVRRAGGQVFVAPVDVILSVTTVLQPDLVFLDPARLGLVTDRAIEGAPTLVVEVLSASSGPLDRGRKRAMYARHGVPGYWIVDPDARVIEALRRAGGAYEPAARLEGPAPRALPPLEDLLLDPAAVWR